MLIGEFNEMAALEPQDLLAFFGAAEVNRFTLSRETSSFSTFIDRHSDYQFRRKLCAAAIIAERSCLHCLGTMTGRIEFVREQIKTLPVAARLLPDMRVRSLTNFTSSARQRFFAIEIQRAPLSGAQRLVKRVMDIVLAAVALIFFSARHDPHCDCNQT